MGDESGAFGTGRKSGIGSEAGIWSLGMQSGRNRMFMLGYQGYLTYDMEKRDHQQSAIERQYKHPSLSPDMPTKEATPHPTPASSSRAPTNPPQTPSSYPSHHSHPDIASEPCQPPSSERHLLRPV